MTDSLSSPTQAKINQHVELLNGYQPFDADFSQIFFEGSEHSFELSTKATSTVSDFLEDPLVRVVVLTGDAGHGKTHLCASVLAKLKGLDSVSEVAHEINEEGYGETDLHTFSDGRNLRIIKDLSEFPTEIGAKKLVDAVSGQGVTLVCANEGRLRSCIDGVDQLQQLMAVLTGSILHGATSSEDSSISVLNLNYQSVSGSAEESDSLVDQLLNEWVVKDAPWQDCDGCGAKEFCPVKLNREQLVEVPNSAGGDVDGTYRREGIRLLFEVVERSGHIVTIRELLIAISHLVTGGLQCSDVHMQGSSQSDHWVASHAYHELLFGSQLEESSMGAMSVFESIRRIDPGRRAIRQVDDRLDPSLIANVGPHHEQVDLGSDGAPKTKKDREREAQAHRQLWQFMRRRNFFDSQSPVREKEIGVSAVSRLGFLHTDEFDDVVNLPTGDHSDLMNELFRGLEAIQGIRRAGFNPLALVDPAFSMQRSSASGSGGVAMRSLSQIVSAEIPIDQARLTSEYAVWQRRNKHGSEPEVQRQVDWIDRRVILTLDQEGTDPLWAIPLNLQEFDFVLRVSSGLESRQHVAHLTRSILRRLGLVASQTSRTSGTIVFGDGQRNMLQIINSRIVRMG